MAKKGKKYKKVKNRQELNSGILDKVRKPVAPPAKVFQDKTKYKRSKKYPQKNYNRF